jgi:hypothetical protein
LRKHPPILFAACLFAALAGGCASPKKPQSEGRAPSLVYSPAARLAEKGDAAPPATGNEDVVRPPAGRRVRLHFRREAIGVAGQAAYPLTGGNNLAADRASVTGTLERVGRDWLVVRGERSTYWVPREAVLAVEFADQQ